MGVEWTCVWISETLYSQHMCLYASQVLIITVCKPKKLSSAHAEELTVYPIPSWIADIRADEGV